MKISRERIRRTRLIQTDQYVVAVGVEMVIPRDDLNEPCYWRRPPLSTRSFDIGVANTVGDCDDP